MGLREDHRDVARKRQFKNMPPAGCDKEVKRFPPWASPWASKAGGRRAGPPNTKLLYEEVNHAQRF